MNAQTTEIRTVRRNSKEASAMWDNATRAISYTLANYFIGEDVAVEGARSWFDRMERLGLRISHNGSAYVIHYHSNHWVELLCPPRAS